MQQKAPPIQWLPVFEAAARHLNFKKAAEELCVTPPAVSQQIKVLEDYLGVPLFDRIGRKLQLTQAGEHYYQTSSDIIKRHAKGYRSFERKFRHPILHVSAPIFIAQELLIPNYMRFKEYGEQVELRLTTGNEYVDFDNEAVDAALRFGEGNWPDLDCRFISDVDLKLVCSQNYIEQHSFETQQHFNKELLEEHRLISVFEDFRDWRSIYPDIKPKDIMICDSYFSAIRSAEEGLGITLGIKPVINRLINEKRLTTLPSDALNTSYAYWLVAPQNETNSEQIKAVYLWVKDLFSSLE